MKPQIWQWAATAALLAGCASGPDIALDPTSDPRAARALLRDTAAAGPVLVTWSGQPPLAQPELLTAVERGVRGMAIRTTAEGEAERRFDFRFPGGDGPVCGDQTVARAFEGGIAAAFCDGNRAVAMARSGPDDPDEAERLIWRLTSRVVPDDYADNYGWNLFGTRIGIGIGSDGVGAGVGVGF